MSARVWPEQCKYSIKHPLHKLETFVFLFFPKSRTLSLQYPSFILIIFMFYMAHNAIIMCLMVRVIYHNAEKFENIRMQLTSLILFNILYKLILL